MPTFWIRITKSLIEMTELKDADRKELKEILTDYEKSTKSKRAAEILSDFESWVPLFKKIIPIDYKNMLTLIGKYEEQGIRHEQAVYEAFKDVSSGSSDAAVRQLRNA